MQLFPAQKPAVERFCDLASARPPARFILAWGTGTGKTIASIEILHRVNPESCLIICPAVMRWQWYDELTRWHPELALQTGVIDHGPGRRSLSSRKKEQLAMALCSRFQIVSYQLVQHITVRRWGMIIVDEAHHLADPKTEQSRCIAHLIHNNPWAHVLMLSATLIPTELRQLWHPLHLLHKDRWGKPAPKTGDVSWDFGRRYCNIETNGYGSAIVGARPEMMPELRERLSRFTSELTRDDIAGDLPPIDVRQLPMPEGDLATHTFAWIAQLSQDTRKVVIFTHHIALATAIFRETWAVRDCDGQLWGAAYIDGGTPFDKRREILARFAEPNYKGILVATSESLIEGVRLAWADRVLIAEWQQSPARVIQLLGRFQSVASTHKPMIEVLTLPSQRRKADALMQRVENINAILKASPTDKAIRKTFAIAKMTDEQVTQHLQSLLGAFNVDRAAWEDDGGDDE